MGESLSQCIERLSALPPKQRLETWRAITDPLLQKLVVEQLPPKLHAEMLGESLVENLNRNVREALAKNDHRAA